MNIKKLESEVKNNSFLLDKEFPELLRTHFNSYVLFNNGEKRFYDSFKDAVFSGEKIYGDNVGFVVRKITNEKCILNLVKHK